MRNSTWAPAGQIYSLQCLNDYIKTSQRADILFIFSVFQQTNSIHDIALAKVVPPIKFSSRVSAVNLPACDDSELGKKSQLLPTNDLAITLLKLILIPVDTAWQARAGFPDLVIKQMALLAVLNQPADCMKYRIGL